MARENGTGATTPTAEPRVRIRMYRQGLGDCFLLGFPAANGPGENGKSFYMLIDCGVVLGTSNPQDMMQAVVADIGETTGHHIDLLVATHEHWDHLSGFLQARDLFDKIQIDRVWLAWTENPTDPLANKLRKERRTAEARRTG
jgi:glyoxylase-like metal-dependent hydrolase (beta-lactamase superfamily II)